jgi:hypothetical protein
MIGWEPLYRWPDPPPYEPTYCPTCGQEIDDDD